MKTHIILFAAGVLASFASVANAKIERVVEERFSVAPGGKLNVQTQGGQIRVLAGSGNEVHVVAIQTFRTNDEEEADEIAKNLTLRIDKSGNDVSAIAKYENGKWKDMFKGGSAVYVSFEVTVPSRYHADLRTSGGNIEVGDLQGEIDAATSGGNVKLGQIDGEVSAHTSGGNITVEGATGDLVAKTSGGNIQIKRIGGKANLDTSGGDIKVERVAGPIDARTSGGSVYATLEDKVSAACSLRTSGGNVTVKVSPAAAFTLDASTSGGSVNVSGVQVTVTDGKIGKTKVIGTVNGGGPDLRLRTSGGDVNLAAR